MLASTIRDFKLILNSLSEESYDLSQYIKKFKPYKWSKRKYMIYLNVLKEFGLIRLNTSITVTEKGRDFIILSKKKEGFILINRLFKLLNNGEHLNELLLDLKHNFLLNPKKSIKKLAKTSKNTRKLGIIGQYVVSILLSSFFLYNELPREEKYLELIAKSFLNSYIDRDGILFKKLFQIASNYNVNKKEIRVELLKKWRKKYRINFPNEIRQILIIALSETVKSLPILIDLEYLDNNFTKNLVKKYPLIMQYVKISKSTDKMKLKITEEIFLDELIIKLK